MNEPSPYQPPFPQPSAPFPLPGHTVPPAMNVFGVLHLVFAGLGILGALWGLFVALITNPFATTAQGPAFDAQRAMEAKTMPMSVATGALSLVVAALMIIAGLKLIKHRKDSLKWSNRYAVSSLVTKFINLVLTITILVPAMQEMSRHLFEDPKMPAGAGSIMSSFMAGGAIGGVVITCAYPILALILLNRPAVKEWVAQHGT